jgi:hypothetical protein
MNSQNEINSSHLDDILVRKLHPQRFAQLSGAMAAVVGFILETTFTEPPIVKIKVEHGVVFARAQGELAELCIGGYADLLHNWLRILSSARLTCNEFMEAQALFALRVGFFGQVCTA